MSNGRQYEKVTGGSDNKRWEPNKLTAPIDAKNPPMLEGYYLQVKDIPGPNGVFNVHTIQTVDQTGALSEKFDVSLGAVIDDVLSKIGIGKWICIQYKGKKPSKTPGRTYNDIDVFVDNKAIPYNQLASKGEIVKHAAVDTGNKNPAAASNAIGSAGNPFPNGNGVDDDLPF